MRWQNVGLVVLLLVTAALAWFTVRHVAPVTVSPVTTPTSVGRGADGAAASTGAGAASGDAAGSGGDGAAATTAAPVGLGTARSALADGDVLAVLGDSTGNDVSEWVFLLAGRLAEARPVTVYPWNEWDEQGYAALTVLAEDGDGPALTVYSGGMSGATAAYPADRVELMVPEDPSLVLLSFGHNNTVKDVADELGQTLDAVRTTYGKKVPVVVVLQQPQAGDANADVRAEVARWAGQERLPTIDVAEAFLEQEDPDALLVDDLHPGEEGQQLWADVVDRALAPR